MTIAAASGQTPVFNTLFLQATGEWAFNGITVQSIATSGAVNDRALIYIRDDGASLPTSNIIFANMTLQTAPLATAQAWTQAQWVANQRAALLAIGSSGAANTTCVSMTDSHIAVAGAAGAGAVKLLASNSLFSCNQIDHFAHDAIDYAASNLTITKNYIHDNEDMGDGGHLDAMQGSIGEGPLPTGAAYDSFSNILIDCNTIVRQSTRILLFRPICKASTPSMRIGPTSPSLTTSSSPAPARAFPWVACTTASSPTIRFSTTG